jgi:hypothetical protein
MDSAKKESAIKALNRIMELELAGRGALYPLLADGVWL